MYTRRASILVVFTVLACGLPVKAQEVVGLVSATTIGTEELVTYTMEVSGADLQSMSNPQPPTAEGLTLLSPTPGQQTSVSIVNGRMSRTVGFTWRYRPEREGSVQFGAGRITIDGSTFTTDPVSIEVVPQAQRPRRQPRSIFNPFGLFDDPEPTPAAAPTIGDRDIFIEARPSAREAFQNEQVTINYDLYFRSGLSPRNSRLADSWDAEGFWREDLEVTDQAVPSMRVLDGTRYNVVTLKRVAVFPTRSGDLAVDPLRIATEVIPPSSNPFDRSLFSLGYTSIERASAAIDIISKPLPADAPDGFSGAVGQYQMDAAVTSTTLEIGEPLQLEVTLRGTGNVALLDAPAITWPGIFEVYDPEVQTNISNEGNLIAGSKTFTWLLIPRSNGTFEFPRVRFAYFNPAIERYVTEESVLPAIEVTGAATRPVAVSATASGFPVDDISPLMRTPRWVAAQGLPLHRQPWVYALIVLPLLALAGVFMARQRAIRLATDTQWARSRSAHPMARKHLKRAARLQKSNQPILFYEALDKAVLSFVGNRLNVAELGLTRPQLRQHLINNGVSESGIDDLSAFLEACDTARFAAQLPLEEQMGRDMSRARTLLSTIAVELEGRPS